MGRYIKFGKNNYAIRSEDLLDETITGEETSTIINGQIVPLPKIIIEDVLGVFVEEPFGFFAFCSGIRLTGWIQESHNYYIDDWRLYKVDIPVYLNSIKTIKTARAQFWVKGFWNHSLEEFALFKYELDHGLIYYSRKHITL